MSKYGSTAIIQSSSSEVYSDGFYDSLELMTLQSARIVVPFLLRLIRPSSVIDVGCGRGAWLRAFQENGVERIKGLDGAHLSQSKLLIDPTCFSPVNLSKPFTIDERYDLAVCLEVAEHLPSTSAGSLIHTLTKAAHLVLFSAAIPKQGGIEHLNEQWPQYWQSLFAQEGFQRLDPIRPLIWQDAEVLWWYRQNIFLYASSEAITNSTILQAEEKIAKGADLELIHKNILYRLPSLREILRQLMPTARRAIKYRLKSSLFRFRTKGA